MVTDRRKLWDACSNTSTNEYNIFVWNFWKTVYLDRKFSINHVVEIILYAVFNILLRLRSLTAELLLRPRSRKDGHYSRHYAIGFMTLEHLVIAHQLLHGLNTTQPQKTKILTVLSHITKTVIIM